MDCLTLTIGVAATFIDSVSNNTDTRYYNMMLSGDITVGFSNLCVMIVEEATEESLQTETVLSLFGLPGISKDNLEEEAELIHSILSARIPINNEHKYCFQAVKIKKKFKIKMWPADLQDDCLGQLHLKPSRATIYDPADMSKPYPDEPIPANTILLSSRYYKNQMKRYDDIITAAHEFVHWDQHQLYFNIMQLLDENYTCMDCTSKPIALNYNMSLREKAYWYAEWQANELAIRIVMPRSLVEKAIDEYNKDETVHNPMDISLSGRYYQNMIYKLSCDFNVPPEIMKKRMRQLEYDFADGTFVTIDSSEYQPFYFTPGTLKENETFVINRSNYERLLKENEDFANLIDSKLFVYTGYVICLNDIKYIRPKCFDGRLHFILSDYACEHADECCMKFSFYAKVNVTKNPVFYGNNFLCKLDDGEYSKCENEIFKLTPAALVDMKSYFKMQKDRNEARKILVEMDNKGIKGFNDALNYHIERKGYKITDLSDEYYLKDDILKKYLSGKRKKPELDKVMVICNKLDLPYDLAIDLLSRAKISLNLNEDKDLLYDYLLTITNAELTDWDMYLKKHDFPSLSNQ